MQQDDEKSDVALKARRAGSPVPDAGRRSFWGELRRRRLFPIAFSYAAGGWLAVEIVDTFVERELLPGVMSEIVMTWYMLGMLAALVIGWFHGERGDQKATRGELASLGVLLIAALVFNAFSVVEDRSQRLARAAAAEGSLDIHRIAVLYFQDTGTGEEQYLADAVTEELIAELSEVRALDVVSRNGVSPFRGRIVAPDSVAQALLAGTIVEGSIQRRGDNLRVDIQLIDGASGAPVRRAGFTHPASDLQGLGAAVAAQAAEALREWLGEEVRLRDSRRATDDVDAWSQFQRAEKLRKDALALLADGERDQAMATMTEADRLADNAASLDGRWAEPSILRAQLALVRGVNAEPPSSAWVEDALDHAADALRREPRNARAWEIRGTIRWRHYYASPGLARDDRKALLDSARADLEQAVSLEPTLASAHVTLSNLYYEIPDLASAVLAGRRAYEEDAYLDNANVVVSRLFYGSIDLEQFGEASRWCDVGAARFPDDVRFALCPIILMAAPAREPDVARAWQLVTAVDTLALPARRHFERVRATAFTAAVIARAGLGDSARAVLRRVEAEIPTADPTQGLFALTAIPYILLNEPDRAIDNYKRYLVVNPQHAFKPDREIGWWWRSLRDHPRFRELLATD